MSNIIYTTKNGVAIITLNRPEKRNAISTLMYQELTEYLIKAETDSSIKAVIIQGQENCFTAGNDIKDFLNSGAFDSNHPTIKFLYKLSNFAKPAVAAIAGAAVGIGTTLLLHCDLVVATPCAKLQLPFTNLGLVPEAASSLLLPNLVGHHKASELLLLGTPFSGEQARDLGLVNYLVDPSDLLSKAQNVAEQLAQKPTEALMLTKALLKMNTQKAINTTMNNELDIFAQCLQSDAAKQAFAAFLKS
ncbi:enoyl-CoA hydratase-related protein [Paraferrimonas sp. SM1919]|uniref:enoyl-CoA hydratase-related protein n=1 Tax=Paraferrimonas sp. SM1919 TaxID=2662263 RepID=UPI0013D43689|nr:enoyl-CoA hydratase-related protein [Paraferrimonas sp. SM1919]